MYELEDIQAQDETFVIDTDAKADWALKIIQQERAEFERLNNTIDEEIEILENKKKRLQEQLVNKTGFLKSKLADYFETVDKKELKTCFKYKLPSGDLVFYKPSITYERDNAKILNWLSDNNKYEYIKTNPTVDWAELKKTAFFEDIDGVVKVENPASFDVK
jgi:hypothetical protein